MKALLEIICLIFNYHLQVLQSNKYFPENTLKDAFSVPYKYICELNLEKRSGILNNFSSKEDFEELKNNPELWPCAQQNEVSCWTSRPEEKTLFVRYMVFTAIFSICISILDSVINFYKILKEFKNENSNDILNIMTDSGISYANKDDVFSV